MSVPHSSMSKTNPAEVKGQSWLGDTLLQLLLRHMRSRPQSGAVPVARQMVSNDILLVREENDIIVELPRADGHRS